MTQSAMRMNMAAARAEQQASQKRAEQKEAKAREAQTAAEGNGSEASPQDGKRGAFTSLKQAVAPTWNTTNMRCCTASSDSWWRRSS